MFRVWWIRLGEFGNHRGELLQNLMFGRQSGKSHQLWDVKLKSG